MRSDNRALCAVAALGIVKGKDKAKPDTPGLIELVKGILDILAVQGSKALHEEIKVMLKVRPFSVLNVCGRRHQL